MFGALKTGVVLAVKPLESCGAGINWSQTRCLRCVQGPAQGVTNGRFTATEIERQYRKGGGNKVEEVPNRYKKAGLSKSFRRSIIGHQNHLMDNVKPVVENQVVIADLCKLIVDNGQPTVRVKNGADEVLVKEWIGVQNELLAIRKDRVDEDRRKFNIAGAQALREMEASLRKGMNLEDLDEAIESALCSERKDQ